MYKKIVSLHEKYSLLSYAYCIFILSFYFATFERLYKDIFYYVVLIPFFVICGREIFSKIKRSIVFRLCVLWLGYLALSILWSPDVTPREAFDVLRAFVLIHLLLAVAIHLSSVDPHFHRRLFVSLAIGAAIMAIATMAWFYKDHDFPGTRLAGFGQIFNSNDVARLYGVAVLTTYFGLVKTGDRWRETILYVAILGILVGFVALTGSRGPAIALATAVLAGTAALRDWKTVAALLLAGATLAGVLIHGNGDGIGLLRLGHGYRLEIWSTVWEWIGHRPWIGFGILADDSVPYSRGIAIHPHNLFLSNQFSGGLVATGLLLLMLAAAAQVAYRQLRTGNDFVLAALLIFVVVAGLFDIGPLLVTINWVWLIFWLPIALICGQEAVGNADGRTSVSVMATDTAEVRTRPVSGLE